MKVLIDKLGNDVKSLGVLSKFEPADATNFKHKCSLLLPGVAQARRLWEIWLWQHRKVETQETLDLQ